MRSGWTAFTNTGLRLLLCLPLLSIFVLFVPDDTLGKGGTNMHEGLPGSRAAVPTYEPTLPSEGFGGCGREPAIKIILHIIRRQIEIASRRIPFRTRYVECRAMSLHSAHAHRPVNEPIRHLLLLLGEHGIKRREGDLVVLIDSSMVVIIFSMRSNRSGALTEAPSAPIIPPCIIIAGTPLIRRAFSRNASRRHSTEAFVHR